MQTRTVYTQTRSDSIAFEDITKKGVALDHPGGQVEVMASDKPRNSIALVSDIPRMSVVSAGLPSIKIPEENDYGKTENCRETRALRF